MRKKLILFFIFIITVFLFIACNSNENSKLENIVNNYYIEEIGNNENYDIASDTVLFANNDFHDGKLILSHIYNGEGEPRCRLFLIENNNENFEIKKIAFGNEPISMGFSINKVKYKDFIILFGVFNDSTWRIEEDIREDVNYTDMKLKLSDGSIIEKNIRNTKGYIIKYDINQKVEKFELYNDDVLEGSMDELGNYGTVINNTKFNDYIK